jgi:hypothetical protein
MERGAMRGNDNAAEIPDIASLRPGYELVEVLL